MFVLELAVAASDPKVNALSLANWLPTRFASDGGTKAVRAVAAFLTRKLEPTLQPPLLESRALEQLSAVRTPVCNCVFRCPRCCSRALLTTLPCFMNCHSLFGSRISLCIHIAYAACKRWVSAPPSLFAILGTPLPYFAPRFEIKTNFRHEKIADLIHDR